MDTILYAYHMSDACGKFVVLLLVAASIFGWSIALYKFMSTNATLKSCRQFREVFRKCGDSPLLLGQQFMGNQYTGPLKDICVAGISELLTILAIPQNEQRRFFKQGKLPRKLTQEEIDKIRSSMDRIANVEAQKLEEKMSTLGTIINVSPMLGLFGTVWGVMETFIGIAKVGKPDIMAIAPGVSGALLTTVAGLIVAVPMLAVNNWVGSEISIIYREMDIFMEEFISSMRLEETMTLEEVQAASSMPSGTQRASNSIR